MQRSHALFGPVILAVIGAFGIWSISTQVFPYHSLNHDEAVYLQQASMLLEGQLNLWPPIDGVLRPWFFVKDGNRLYPKYTPVPAAMFALGKLFGNYRFALVGIAMVNVILVISVIQEVFDRYTGLLAGTFFLFSPLFLIDSSVFLPYAPTTLLNLIFAYGYFRADRTDSILFAIVSGTSIGLAFFARPYTAVLFAIPFIFHAFWNLYTNFYINLPRQVIIGIFGLLGVIISIIYNFFMTGSPWTFPYEAFAPLDGLGFGHRQILGHEIFYTLELGLRASLEILELFLTEWITGGILGAVLAFIGIIYTIYYDLSSRKLVIAGLFISIVCGNIYFWGNFNILGNINRANDGLISAFGPYYHFDLLLPTAAFAAKGAVWSSQIINKILRENLNKEILNIILILTLISSTSAVAAVTSNNLSEHIDKNMAATNTYEKAYEPFRGGAPKNSIILVPDPYGNWLNHPFQVLRNNPGFYGRAIYAINDKPFEIFNTFSNRTMYRYVYRGTWAPYSGSPEAARLQRIHAVSGPLISLETKVGIPDEAIGTTVRITADGENIYYTSNVSDNLDINLMISKSQVWATGDITKVGNETLKIEEKDTILLTVFVDYGAGRGFTYRLDLDVNVIDDKVRALSPRVERCRNPQICGGSAAYIPELAPEDIFVHTELISKPNS